MVTKIEDFPVSENIKKLITQGTIEDIRVGLEILIKKCPDFWESLKPGSYLYHYNKKAWNTEHFKEFTIDHRTIVMGSHAFWLLY